MNVKELRNDIISSMEFAQEHSMLPRTTEGSYAYEHHIVSDYDRVRMFLAALYGRVGDGDPQLAKAIKAFMDAKPGVPLPGQAAPASAADTSTPAGAA